MALGAVGSGLLGLFISTPAPPQPCAPLPSREPPPASSGFPSCQAVVWNGFPMFSSQSISLYANTLGTLGGSVGSPSCHAQSGDMWKLGVLDPQHPGTPDVPRMSGRPCPALGHTDLWLSLERRAGAPCGQDGLRHCPLSSRPHVIVTFDLAWQPIGQGLGGPACGAGRKGLCPCRPLTKYRNSRGGGPRR